MRTFISFIVTIAVVATALMMICVRFINEPIEVYFEQHPMFMVYAFLGFWLGAIPVFIFFCWLFSDRRKPLVNVRGEDIAAIAAAGYLVSRDKK